MSEKSKYPWLRLLDLDLKPAPTSSTKRRGRPKNSFPRRRVGLTLTEDELATLDEMVELFSDQFEHTFARGHIIAFLVFYMRDQLMAKGSRRMRIPEDIKSFVELADYLNKET